jgi:magnesium-transporting ATPase (P-type)
LDLKTNQFIINLSNVYRSTNSQRIKNINNSMSIAGVNLGLNAANANFVDNEDKYGILIEGHTLAHVIDSKSMTERFLKILGQCQAVIVCRASPSQKA